MNVKLLRYFYFGLMVLFVGIIITSVYYILGGFDQVRVYSLEPEGRVVVGKQFNTRYTDNAPREFGLQCKELIESNELEGTLTTITYKSDTLDPKEVSIFIGITLANDMAEIPEGFEIREFPPAKRYAVFLSMHVLVQPRPYKVEAMLQESARENGDELEDFFFELRYPDNSLSVEGWVND